MKAWFSVSAAEDERVGRRRFLTLFVSDVKESGGSMMMQRFLTTGKGVTE